PGDCATQAPILWAPPAGSYWVGAIADQHGWVAETLEDNNAATGTRLAVGYAPDFAVTSVTAPPSALPGSSVQVTATLCNQGTLGAGAPAVEVFFSTDTTITGNDFLG